MREEVTFVLLFISCTALNAYTLALKEGTVSRSASSRSTTGLQPPLCSSGTVWQELQIVPSGDTRYVSLELSGRGDEIVISCLSGFFWDYASGHPHMQLQLYNIDTLEYANITSKVNQTYYDGPALVFKSSRVGKWGLKLTNQNLIWWAYSTLVIDYFIRPSPPSCKTCPNPGYSGPNCDQPCSANCYECCQDDKNVCTVCAAGTWDLPSCDGQCPDYCLYCDNMGGCHVCKNPAVSGPNCDQCRPAPCQQPNLAKCAAQCDDNYYWCDLCMTATTKASEVLQIIAEVYETEKGAEAAIVAATGACLFLTPIVAIGCDFGLTVLVESGVIKFAISWLFKEAANELIARNFCALIHLCPGPLGEGSFVEGGMLALPSNATRGGW